MLAPPTVASVLTCEPGGEAVKTLVPIAQQGRTLDRLALRLDGLDPSWYRLEPAQVTLRPGEQSEVQLTFTVPAAAPAGLHPYRVLAVSASGGERTILQSAIEVSTLADLQLEVLPYRQRARGAAGFRVRVRNFGNA